jgi:CheY-like chemotaxis protein
VPDEVCNRLQILLVEDDELNQKLTLAILEAAGYFADLAPNGFEAIESVKRSEYDLVLMDIQMPEISGLQATSTIRALPAPKCNVRIVALTATRFSREDLLSAGIDDYLPKPLKVEALLEVIRVAERLKTETSLD